jgi:hypothetical protein
LSVWKVTTYVCTVVGTENTHVTACAHIHTHTHTHTHKRRQAHSHTQTHTLTCSGIPRVSHYVHRLVAVLQRIEVGWLLSFEGVRLTLSPEHSAPLKIAKGGGAAADVTVTGAAL